jgi:IS1 family transposase
MNQLSTAERAQIITALVEGNSIRSIVRMTGRSKNTIAKLLVEVGAACASYQDKALRNLPCRRVQCDEIWSFCYAKDKNLPADKKNMFGYGSVWTWTALDADTKLIATWMVGNRGAEAAREFISDLQSRLANRIQLTTDGPKVYADAVSDAFGSEIDYAKLSPAVCVGTRTDDIAGTPDRKHVSTTYVERQNLTMRMHMRRFTRLTNGFSKKLENHIAAISLHFMYYNFCRIHQTLRISPAMAAGVTGRLWEIADIIALLEGEHAQHQVQRAERRDWNGKTG